MSLKYEMYFGNVEAVIRINFPPDNRKTHLFCMKLKVLLQLRFAKRNFACALQANHPFLISRFDFNCKNDRGINLKKLFNLDFIRFSSTAVPFLCRGRKRNLKWSKVQPFLTKTEVDAKYLEIPKILW